ncbi:MAG: C39 family peptidase [Ruminococcus sp.]|nr:C39 family peptidase [Ruminococcus sp.]
MKRKTWLLPMASVMVLATSIAVPLLTMGKTSPEQLPPQTTVASSPTATADSAATVDEPATEPDVTHSEDAHIINVNALLQDELESGCEVYSATMLLQYYGYSIDEFVFAEDYLTVMPTWVDDDGIYYGPDLNSAFAGEVEWGYGAYAPALRKAINTYLAEEDSDYEAVAEKDVTLQTLYESCLRRDKPVMVWMTTDMALPEETISWTIDYVDENAAFEEGDTFEWPVNEHCMLLCGYDEDNYYFADPLEGSIVRYEKELCEEIFEAMGGQAVYLNHS